jgi:hypothetical protein
VQLLSLNSGGLTVDWPSTKMLKGVLPVLLATQLFKNQMTSFWKPNALIPNVGNYVVLLWMDLKANLTLGRWIVFYNLYGNFPTYF